MLRQSPRRRRRAALLGGLLGALALSGCGGDAAAPEAAAGGEVVVSAASSLKQAFTSYGDAFAGRARFSFAGSDLLAAQLRQGLKPDVFASANTTLPAQLFKQGLVERPVTFATNRLVLAVPAGSTAVRSLADLSRDGVTIAIGSPSAPIGAYTRTVLGRLGAARRQQLLANVRSNEPDVGGVVGKLSQGAVDAGFVYATDVAGSGGRLTAITLPAALRPQAAYAVAVVRGAAHPEQAKAFIAGLLAGRGQAALAAAGFQPPPADAP